MNQVAGLDEVTLQTSKIEGQAVPTAPKDLAEVDHEPLQASDATTPSPRHKPNAKNTPSAYRLVHVPPDQIRLADLPTVQGEPLPSEVVAALKRGAPPTPLLGRVRADGFHEPLENGPLVAALVELGLPIPMLVAEVDDRQALINLLTRETQAPGLTLVQQRESLMKLKELDPDRTWKDIARQIGWTPARVSQVIATTEAPQAVAELLDVGRITERQYRSLKHVSKDNEPLLVAACQAVADSSSKHATAQATKVIEAADRPFALAVAAVDAVVKSTARQRVDELIKIVVGDGDVPPVVVEAVALADRYALSARKLATLLDQITDGDLGYALTASKLARAQGIPQPDLDRLIKAALEAGVNRVKSDTNKSTRSAPKAAARVKRSLTAIEEAVTSELSADEREALAAQLDALAAKLRALSTETHAATGPATSIATPKPTTSPTETTSTEPGDERNPEDLPGHEAPDHPKDVPGNEAPDDDPQPDDDDDEVDDFDEDEA